MSKNKGRISSDNYDIMLVLTSHPDKPIIYLSKDYGITGFKWELREEVIVTYPVTRLDAEVTVIPKGVDIEFATKKENLDDLMMLFLTQHALSLGRYATNENFGLKLMGNTMLGANLRTNPSNNKPEDQVKEGKRDNHVANGVSIFNNNSSVHYVTPTFDLIVRIKHFVVDTYTSTDVYTNLEEGFIFKNVKLFSPAQAVSENSSNIEESFKAFAGWVQILNTSKKENRWTQYLTEMVSYQFTEKTPEKIPYLNRRIVNPNNKKFIK